MTVCSSAEPSMRASMPTTSAAGFRTNWTKFWRIGAALTELLYPGPVVLARDIRLSSPELQTALAAGLYAGGREVIDIGLCGTATRVSEI